MGDALDARRAETNYRFKQLQSELAAAKKLAGRRACVYATGSFGRGEASEHSDLDLFILGRGRKEKPRLSKLDEICIKSDLIRATQKLGIPKFSGDGAYLIHYTVHELIDTLGKRTDDASNTFTARLLLLLESEPLLGSPVYDTAITEVINAYWRDYEGREGNFSPAFLVN